jgi:hypothetical protein
MKLIKKILNDSATDIIREFYEVSENSILGYKLDKKDIIEINKVVSNKMKENWKTKYEEGEILHFNFIKPDYEITFSLFGNIENEEVEGVDVYFIFNIKDRNLEIFYD